MRVNKVEAHASVARATGSRGAQVVFDTVGGPMFEPALKALGASGQTGRDRIGCAKARSTAFDENVRRGIDGAADAVQRQQNGSSSDEGVSGDVR